MKRSRLILLLLAVFGAQSVWADDGISRQTYDDVTLGAVLVTFILILLASLAILRAVKVLERVILGPETAKEAVKPDRKARKEAIKAARAERWIKLLSLKPMSEEHTLVMEDEYDGIRELNNPTPAWFMYLFYATITFAVCYLLIYHVFKAAPLQYDEYKIEMAQAAKDKAAYLAKTADKVDENTVKLTTDPAALADGKTIFSQNCAACHGPNGQGVVGPNLTDDYWLHGNKISDIFKTVKYGVLSKGMPTWEKQLTPKQISDVANYIKSIRGTNPANPKEPQGIKMTEDDKSDKTSKTVALIRQKSV